jgi:hypothetical protein
MHSFQVFFEAGAGVAGGLVGLLFVAISVMPHKMSGEGASTDFQVRAALASTPSSTRSLLCSG